MTIPPDTPKPPAELWMLPDPDDGRPRIANEQQIGSVRYILAPSPQESHKLAEELESVILWALGEIDEFPDWPATVTIKGNPKYWWRTELRKRYTAAIAASGGAKEDGNG